MKQYNFNHSFTATIFVFIFIISFPLQSKAQSLAAVSSYDAVKWREDLRFMAGEMQKKHKNLFHTVTREQFDSAVKKLDERIPNLARHQIIVEIARIVAMVGDGHTVIPFSAMHGLPSKTNFRQYPVKLYFFKDGLFVKSAVSEYAKAVGGRVVQIGNTTSEQAFEAVKDIVSRDNEMTVKENAPSLMMMPEVLHALGLINDMEKTALTVEKNGQKITVELKPFTSETSAKWIDARDEAKSANPLWLKSPDNFYWFEYLPESHTMYVQFNVVFNKQDESISSFFKRVFEQVESLPVERFVVDLRQNSGGDGFYIWSMIYGLIRSEKINKKGKLYAIIGRRTFSAAEQAVVALERHTNVLFVGEPTGGSPNGYGNQDSIHLQNSGIGIMVSPFYWQNSTPWDIRKWVAPQVFVELSSQDYLTNNDPILKTIFTYKSLTEQLTDALSSNDINLAVRKYREFKTNPTNIYANTLGEVNSLGYRLMESKRFDHSIEILKLNVEAYPKSWIVYDSLAEAYMKSGNKELAIKNYEKALELNPSNDRARQILKSLKG